MIRTFTVAILGVLASTAHAQFGNPAGLSPDTPRMDAADPPPDHANTQDKLFVRQAAIGGRAEVELGKLAQQKGASSVVKDFAQRMIEDHGKGNDRLVKTARGVPAEIPKDLDPEHERVRSELEKLSGAEFDTAYLTAQIRDHQKTANLLMWQISFGQHEPLKKYAADTLPLVLDHLVAAQMHYAALTSSPPPK